MYKIIQQLPTILQIIFRNMEDHQQRGSPKRQVPFAIKDLSKLIALYNLEKKYNLKLQFLEIHQHNNLRTKK